MTDYESDSMDGQQPDMIAVPRAEWERVHGQLAAAREALEAVEWVWDSTFKIYRCPWCHGEALSSEWHINHLSDCPRQAALAAMEEKP